jgi:hypothetical protein
MGWLKNWQENRLYKKELKKYQKEKEEQKKKLWLHGRYYYPKRTKKQEGDIYLSRLERGEAEISASSDLDITDHKRKRKER